jgi:polyisoprenoid-binding protein YceI
VIKPLKCTFVFAASLFVLLFSAYAQSETPAPKDAVQQHRVFSVDPAKSTLSFLLKGNVHNTEGAASKLSGETKLSMSPDGRLASAQGAVTLAAAALDTKNDARDKRMKNEFLEVQKYPDIAFHFIAGADELKGLNPLAAWTREKPVKLELDGDLALHGQIKKVRIQMKAYLENSRLIAEGQMVVILKDFAINNPSLLFLRVEDAVSITIHIELEQRRGQ